MLGVALLAGAALTSALAIWQQWTVAGEVRSRPGREVVQQAAPAAVAPEADALAVGTPGNESPADPTAGPVPQESLLALTIEQNAKGAARTPDAAPRLVHPAPAQPARNYAVIQRVPTETESDMSMSSDDPVGRAAASRPAASRAVVADSRSQRHLGARPVTPARAVWTAQGSATPCNRYNPFGDAVCATIPDSSRQSRSRLYSQR